MASIQKRGKKYAVVYTYEDGGDNKRQKWESFPTKKYALVRKAAVENELNSGTFIFPSDITVEMFLKDFVELYGTKTQSSERKVWIPKIRAHCVL